MSAGRTFQNTQASDLMMRLSYLQEDCRVMERRALEMRQLRVAMTDDIFVAERLSRKLLQLKDELEVSSAVTC